jgi:hypothetical protein
MYRLGYVKQGEPVVAGAEHEIGPCAICMIIEGSMHL